MYTKKYLRRNMIWLEWIMMRIFEFWKTAVIKVIDRSPVRRLETLFKSLVNAGLLKRFLAILLVSSSTNSNTSNTGKKSFTLSRSLVYVGDGRTQQR